MDKYIDAEKLTTIIEERKAQQDQWINRYHDPINQGISQELTEILSIIDSLQQEQPEVDIKKKLHAYICSDEYMNTREDGSLLIARHFYGLGKTARKEE